MFILVFKITHFTQKMSLLALYHMCILAHFVQPTRCKREFQAKKFTQEWNRFSLRMSSFPGDIWWLYRRRALYSLKSLIHFTINLLGWAGGGEEEEGLTSYDILPPRIARKLPVFMFIRCGIPWTQKWLFLCWGSGAVRGVSLKPAGGQNITWRASLTADSSAFLASTFSVQSTPAAPVFFKT